jgi:hypothetical protein
MFPMANLTKLPPLNFSLPNVTVSL